MLISRFLFMWLVLSGGFAALLFLWRTITVNFVVTTAKLVTAGALAFVVSMFIFLMEK